MAVLHSHNQPQEKQLPAPSQTSTPLHSSHGELAGVTTAPHAESPHPLLPEHEGQAQPISGTTNTPAPKAPVVPGTAGQPWATLQQSQPRLGGRTGCPQGKTPIPTRQESRVRRVQEAEAVQVPGWRQSPWQLPQLVPCPCCAEPCVDVSVLAIKILNKVEVSSL